MLLIISNKMKFLKLVAEKGWTIGQLAKTAKVSVPTTSRAIKGARPLRPSTALKLAEALNCDVLDVFKIVMNK